MAYGVPEDVKEVGASGARVYPRRVVDSELKSEHDIVSWS
jgi:hypothetical protein